MLLEPHSISKVKEMLKTRIQIEIKILYNVESVHRLLPQVEYLVRRRQKAFARYSNHTLWVKTVMKLYIIGCLKYHSQLIHNIFSIHVGTHAHDRISLDADDLCRECERCRSSSHIRFTSGSTARV